MRYDPIPAHLFADRRRSFLRAMKRNGLAVICSNETAVRTGDQLYPFRQNSDLFRLTGIEQEETILVLCPNADDPRHREILFILSKEPLQELWHGERLTPARARAISGIQTVYTFTRWTSVMKTLRQTAGWLYLNRTIAPSRPAHPSPTDRRLHEALANFPKETHADPTPILTSLAMIKHPVERELMKKAIDVTGEAFHRIAGILTPGMKEYELEAEITHTFLSRGCQHAYEPIIASGKSACILHYTRNDQVMRSGELVLLDFGAAYANMSSDLSRTLPVSGRFTSRQRLIYMSVLRVLGEITAIMRPGITLKELNQATGACMDRELIHLRLISRRELQRQDPDDPVRRKYFMHGISHHLGYDVHDPGDRSVPLRAGMVLTCEPGLYIAAEKTGIRLENDILITRGKPVNLTAHIPIHPDEIESLMNPG